MLFLTYNKEEKTIVNNLSSWNSIQIELIAMNIAFVKFVRLQMPQEYFIEAFIWMFFSQGNPGKVKKNGENNAIFFNRYFHLNN